MSTWIDKEDCIEVLNFYKKSCKGEDEAYERAADSLNISPDRLLEILNDDKT
jgi:hypothetical protein